MLSDYLPIVIILILSAGLAFFMVKLSTLFGPQRPNKEKLSTYESGMEPVGTARERFTVKFYMVAVSFIVFDIEIVFLYPWAVTFMNLSKEEMVYSFVISLIFLVILVAGLIYEYLRNVIQWD